MKQTSSELPNLIGIWRVCRMIDDALKVAQISVVSVVF